MYTIKTENFILTLTPVANSVMINVWSEGFSAEVISFNANGDVLNGNVYKTDVLEIIRTYRP